MKLGLTSRSTGIKAVDMGLVIKRQSGEDRVIALAGNPNVGKSTVFNELTGMNQHTGNWSGKTVTNAQGTCTYRGRPFILVDIPGCYSLMAHSAEEEVARDFLCFGHPDAVVVVCDATCLERNMNLVLQALEITNRVVVCVNLMDEAERKGIRLDLERMSERLGVPVVPAAARSHKGLDDLMDAVCRQLDGKDAPSSIQVSYIRPIEDAIAMLQPSVATIYGESLNARWLSLRLLDHDDSLLRSLNDALGFDLLEKEEIVRKLQEAKQCLHSRGISQEDLRDQIVSSIVRTAEKVCTGVVVHEKTKRELRDQKIDRILTSKWTGFPVMLLLLGVIFWLTITGANYPSELLSEGLFWLQDRLMDGFIAIGVPAWLRSMLVEGVYRVLAWVVSVMLPPMAIFFPLFTLLEDLGYLPRVAFNLDKYFKKAHACGKQALTMCMGFGCNAAGIVGCRIIDSPRERLIAMITNSFVPCNGRFAPPHKGETNPFRGRTQRI